jgi:NAD+ diphosphatase
MFELGFLTTASPGTPSLVVRVRGGSVAIEEGPLPEHAHYLGSLDGLPCVAVEEPEVADSTGFVALRQLWGQVGAQVWAIAGRAVQVVDWDVAHRFCGRCGTSTRPMTDQRARHCPKCGLDAYPRLAPAVIVLVERDDGRALLARNASFSEPFFSCLAGFVEPGETLEEAVHREVREEVGIEVCALQYFRSQPWPFPHSLMIGFTARLASGELRPDGQEITEAAWFPASDLPRLPGEISIARALVEAWRERSQS